jgi:5'-3' exonuclease
MKTKGLNLIIDGNYILNRVVFILKKTGSIYGELEDSYINYVNNHIASYPFDNMYLVSDNKGSWRKDIYAEYKANRKDKDPEVDWEFVFNTYNLIKEKLSEKMNVLDTPKIEGDDWIRYIIEQSNNKGYSCLTLSSDQDLNQMLRFDIVKGYMNMQYRDDINPKLYIPQNYGIYMGELENAENDLFTPSESHEIYRFIQSIMNKTIVDEVDPEKLVFVKLISGDSGDNIKSVISVPQKKDPTKTSGIGTKGAENIFTLYKDSYNEPIDFSSDVFIKNVIPFIIDNKKMWHEKETYTEMITEKLQLNKRLVILDDQYLPDNIKNNLKF